MIVTAAQILASIKAAGGEVEDRPRRGAGRPRLNRTCSFDWCPERHMGNGYCRKHNWSLLYYGDPLATSRRGNPPEEADAHLWPFCTRVGWTGHTGKSEG